MIPKFRAKAIVSLPNSGIKVGDWLQSDMLSSDPFDSLMFFFRFMSRVEHPEGLLLDPTTLGMATGLKDKNGKEIYEGDVCRVVEGYIRDMDDPDPTTRIIKWDDDIGGFNHFRTNGEKGGSGWSFCVETLAKYYVVIGSIHDEVSNETKD